MDVALKDILDNLTKWAQLAPIFPLLVGVIRYRKLSEAQQFFTLFLVFVCFNQLLAALLADVWLVSNLPLYHLYILVEGLCLFWLYSKRLKNVAWVKKYFSWIIIVYGALVIANAFYSPGIYSFPSTSRSLESIFLLVLALYYFHFIFKEGKVKYLDRSFWFWVNSGLLIYFSSNLMLFLFTHLLSNREDQLFLAAWSIHGVLNVVLYAFYTKALLCQDQES